MNYYKVTFSLLIISTLSACTSSGYRDMNIADSSENFNNFEISKNINERVRVQFESSITKTKGDAFSGIAINNSPDKNGKQFLMDDGTYAYPHSPNSDKISIGDLEYAASQISYKYSVKHQTLSGSYDFIHREHFGLRLALGISQYDYTVKAKMHGDVDVYKLVESPSPVQFRYDTGSSSIISYYSDYKIPQGKVTDKQLNFDFTDYGLYVAIEPHYHINKHYGVSLRLATSVGEDTTIGTNINSELSVRFNYNPVEPVEIYLGYQHFSLGKDLGKDNVSTSSRNKGSDLSIDTRGLLMGLAVRL